MWRCARACRVWRRAQHSQPSTRKKILRPCLHMSQFCRLFDARCRVTSVCFATYGLGRSALERKCWLAGTPHERSAGFATGRGRETYGFCNRSLSYHSTRTMHTLHPPRAGCRRAHQERHATDKKKGSCFCHTPLFRYELRGLRLYTIGYAKQYHGVPVVLKWQLHMHVDVRTSCIFAHRSCAQH